MSKKLNFETFQQVIDFYYDRKKTEYEIGYGIKSAHNNLLPYQEGVGEVKNIKDGMALMVVNQNAIDRFHPNKINNAEFWKYAKQKFPKFSVCGSPSKSIKHCNEKTLMMPKDAGLLEFIDKFIAYFSDRKIDFLEIGYGHGNIFQVYKDKVNYKGIDFYKIPSLNKFKNLMVIDKSGIPDSIEDESQDIVYSINVLQHCSQQDRHAYYEQAYRKLRPGGCLIGGTFMWAKEIADLPVWGVVDENGRYYTHFFNQLTEIDTYDEHREKMREIGFSHVGHQLTSNYYSFVVKK